MSQCLLEDLVHGHTKYFHFCWQGDEFACASCDQKGSFFYPSWGHWQQLWLSQVAPCNFYSSATFPAQLHLGDTKGLGLYFKWHDASRQVLPIKETPKAVLALFLLQGREGWCRCLVAALWNYILQLSSSAFPALKLSVTPAQLHSQYAQVP